MGLKEVKIKKAYSSDFDNILLDFYIPVLSHSVGYNRLAGFFSSSSLAIAARGISRLLKNDGIMRLVVSPKLRKDEFLFAMAIGFKNKVKPSLKMPKDGFFLTKDLKPEDEALINAMAVWESNSVDVLSNKEEVFKIAEEYAHGGVRILHDSIGSTQFGSFSKQFEKMLHEIHEELMSEMV